MELLVAYSTLNAPHSTLPLDNTSLRVVWNSQLTPPSKPPPMSYSQPPEEDNPPGRLVEQTINPKRYKSLKPGKLTRFSYNTETGERCVVVNWDQLDEEQKDVYRILMTEDKVYHLRKLAKKRDLKKGEYIWDENEWEWIHADNYHEDSDGELTLIGGQPPEE